jgi:hypothetical protein
VNLCEKVWHDIRGCSCKHFNELSLELYHDRSYELLLKALPLLKAINFIDKIYKFLLKAIYRVINVDAGVKYYLLGRLFKKFRKDKLIMSYL